MQEICNNNYADFKNLLDLKEDFSVIVNDYSFDNTWTCEAPFQSTTTGFTINRIVSIDGNSLGELILTTEPIPGVCVDVRGTCQNAQDSGLCDGLDIACGIGYTGLCCSEYVLCCSWGVWIVYKNL